MATVKSMSCGRVLAAPVMSDESAGRNQRGAGGSGQALPPERCGELGQPEAAGALRLCGGSGDCAPCAPGWAARTVPVVEAGGSTGFATTLGLGFGLGFGFASAGSAVASFGGGSAAG